VSLESGLNRSPMTTLPRRHLGAVFLGIFVAACARRGEKAAKSPTLPEYSGADALVFDDVLAPALFGFDPQLREAATEPKLRDRVQRADYVMPVRVDSLSRGGAGYELTLSPTGPALAGDHAGPIVLLVPTGSPSFAWVDGAGSSFAGSRLIVFCKAFQSAGDQIVHFRGEPDTAAVRKAVERDAALRLLR
jgi:hypothetical protein